MARRREAETEATAGRRFTVEESARIRRLIEGWPFVHGHPHPYVDELEQIHAAAGRRRDFKLWACDTLHTPEDFERAYREEITETFDRWCMETMR